MRPQDFVDRQTDGQTDGQVESSIPPYNSLFRQHNEPKSLSGFYMKYYYFHHISSNLHPSKNKTYLVCTNTYGLWFTGGNYRLLLVRLMHTLIYNYISIVKKQTKRSRKEKKIYNFDFHTYICIFSFLNFVNFLFSPHF